MTLHKFNEALKRAPERKHDKILKRKEMLSKREASDKQEPVGGGLHLFDDVNKTMPLFLDKLKKVREASDKEEKTNRFIQAEEMELFDNDGRNIEKWKGIVNCDDTTQMFAIVGRGYKIAQHDEVVDSIETSIDELELAHTSSVRTMNSGGRIQATMRFPKVTGTLSNGVQLVLRITFDNSYDSTTGLRMNLTAITEKNNILHTTDQKATYYHRHTKGMDTKNLRKKLEKGIDVFKETIMNDFQKMLDNKLDLPKVLNFLDKSIKEKVISVKYLEMIQDRLKIGSSQDVGNQFDLYNLISEVLTAQVDSIDAQKRHIETMFNKIKDL